MLVAADFREKARNSLSGNWGVAIGAGLVANLLGAYTAFSGGGGGGGGASDFSEEDMEMLSGGIPEEALILMAIILGFIAIVFLIATLFTFIVGGPVTLGYVKFNLDLINGNCPNFSDLFSQFGRIKDAFFMQLLRSLFIFLWSLLLIVPGVIAGFSYAMTPYILYENPGMTASEAIAASKKMMNGNKWRLFCLNFSFLGWSILAILSLGIGFLWLNPYMEASYAAFYEELKREQSADGLYIEG